MRHLNSQYKQLYFPFIEAFIIHKVCNIWSLFTQLYVVIVLFLTLHVYRLNTGNWQLTSYTTKEMCTLHQIKNTLEVHWLNSSSNGYSVDTRMANSTSHHSKYLYHIKCVNCKFYDRVKWCIQLSRLAD